MNTENNPCPPAEILQQFAQDDLDPADKEAVNRHLSHCSTCAASAADYSKLESIARSLNASQLSDRDRKRIEVWRSAVHEMLRGKRQ